LEILRQLQLQRPVRQPSGSDSIGSDTYPSSLTGPASSASCKSSELLTADENGGTSSPHFGNESGPLRMLPERQTCLLQSSGGSSSSQLDTTAAVDDVEDNDIDLALDGAASTSHTHTATRVIART
jgi:hypothetical protein